MSSMLDPGHAQATSWHGTTILTVRKGGRVVVAGDGQVSLGATVIKGNARKVRSLGRGDVIGFPTHAFRSKASVLIRDSMSCPT